MAEPPKGPSLLRTKRPDMTETIDMIKRPYACLRDQTFRGPTLTILRLQQEEIARQLRYDLTEEAMESICRQQDGALTHYRKKREWFGENSYDRKALESLWEVSVEIARLERKSVPCPPQNDWAHWLNWRRSEWPCVY